VQQIIVNQKETWAQDGEAEAITKAVAVIAEQRAVIEQAKGVLMTVYDIDAESAFDLLKWRSQATNIKLRVLAERLLTGFRERQWGQKGLPRLTLDRILLTAHQDASAVADQTG
jgi:ANTAR domain